MHSGKVNRRSFLIGSVGLTLSQVGFGQRRGNGDGKAQSAAKDGRAPWKKDVDQIVQSMLTEDNVPSAVIGVVKDGQVAYVKGYGVKQLPKGGVPDENTVYHIGSLSKALTAVGALTLVQLGKLDLDKRASQYIKDLPPLWKAITVKQFMTHTSGIPDISKRKKNAQGDIKAVYGLMEAMLMAFPPGSKEEYNNFNFAVTGDLIETISGIPYLDFMKRRVFAPLGMDHSGVGILNPGNQATGYNLDASGNPTATDAEVISFGIPSGGLATTVADLLKLEAGLRNHKILRPAILKQMIQPVQGFNSTPGWFARNTGQGVAISKNGAAVGFSSFFSFVPDLGDAIIMVRNAKGKGIGIQRPSNQILKSCCGIAPHGGKLEGDDG